MEAVKNIDKNLEKSFKDLPHLPESTREGLAKIWPWLALIGGILQLLAGLALYRLANYANNLNDLVNSLYVTTAKVGPSSFDKTVIYVGVAVLVVEAILLLMAFPKLQKRERAGWNLLFLGALINVVYSVLQIFTYDRGFGSFVGGLIGSAVGFYLLYEIKAKFSKGTAAAK